jgi:hypothetical protein
MNPKITKYNVVGHIMLYEDGDLSQEEIVILFQYLVDSGMAWQLQGAYGRMATQLIDAGIVIKAEVKA